MTIPRNDEIQAAIISLLKNSADISAILSSYGSSISEIREDQWQGTEFIYPNVRVRLISNIPNNSTSECRLSSINVSISVYTDYYSSFDGEEIAAVISETLHGKTFTSRPITIFFKREDLIPAMRTDMHTWKVECIFSGAATVGKRAGEYIYGVYWGKVADPTLTRTDDAIGMVAEVGVDNQVVRNDFDTAEIFGEMHDVTDSYGNVFVRIPKFYIEKTDGANYKTWRISKTKFSDACYLPACFVNSDYIDVGKYNSYFPTGTSSIESKPDRYFTLSGFPSLWIGSQMATNLGENYHLLDIHIWDILVALVVVEFATLNTQSIMMGWTSGRFHADLTTVAENNTNRVIVANATADLYRVGQGITCGSSFGQVDVFNVRTIQSIDVYDVNNKAIIVDGSPFNVAVGKYLTNTPWKTGFSSSILASSGSLGDNTSGKYPCKYRGIENLWGSIATILDGITIYNKNPYICMNYKDYYFGKSTYPYFPIGFSIVTSSESYITSIQFDILYPFLELPIADGGSSTTYYSDTVLCNTNDSVILQRGGYYNQVGGKSKAGIFYTDVSWRSGWGINSQKSTRLVREVR